MLTRTAVVAGIGPGLGHQLCLRLAADGYRVVGLARRPEAGAALQAALGDEAFLALQADVGDPEQLAAALDEAERRFGAPRLYVHNAATLHHAAFLDTEPAEFERQWRAGCLGAVLGARRVLPAMLERGDGVLLFIGATAAVKAGAGFAAFASAKFALRGLAQSLARELGPRGVHVAHLVIDGVIWGARARESFGLQQQQCLDPAAIAETCLAVAAQPRSAWTHELDIRPDVEGF